MLWEHTLRDRLRDFQGPRREGVSVSIKVRVISGCFHREHSPAAYEIIDKALRERGQDGFRFEEHESGPELLVFLNVITAGLALTTVVIDLVTTIIKARSEGQKKGDFRHDPLELIVRGFDKNGKMYEERVLKISPEVEVSRAAVEKALGAGLRKQLPPLCTPKKKPDSSANPSPKKSKRRKHK